MTKYGHCGSGGRFGAGVAKEDPGHAFHRFALLIIAALAGAIATWAIRARRAKTQGSELKHGCRAQLGPLELRIQSTVSSNGFVVYVEDTRLEHPQVYEQAIQSTLESAKEYVALRAHEYLNGKDSSGTGSELEMLLSIAMPSW